MSPSPNPRRRLTRLFTVAVAAAALAVSGAVVSTAGAAPDAAPQHQAKKKAVKKKSSQKGGCATRTNNTYDKLLGCVTLKGVRAHQAELQAIADRGKDSCSQVPVRRK